MIYVINIPFEKMRNNQHDQATNALLIQYKMYSSSGWLYFQFVLFVTWQAREALQHGFETEEYKSVMEGMGRLLPAGMTQRLSRHYW